MRNYITTTVLYCTVLYCTVLYFTVLYCTVLYCTVLYSALLSIALFGCNAAYEHTTEGRGYANDNLVVSLFLIILFIRIITSHLSFFLLVVPFFFFFFLIISYCSSLSLIFSWLFICFFPFSFPFPFPFQFSLRLVGEVMESSTVRSRATLSIRHIFLRLW